MSKIREVRRLIRRCLKERKFLMKRLDKYGDPYKSIPIVTPFERDSRRINPQDNNEEPEQTASVSETVGETKKRKRRPPGNPVGRPKKPRPEKSEDPPVAVSEDISVPKRPQNPYHLYCQEQRSVVKREFLRLHNLNLGKRELGNVLAQRWSDMTEHNKQVSFISRAFK